MNNYLTTKDKVFVLTEAFKYEANRADFVKSAARRSRVLSVELGKLLKTFRRDSVHYFKEKDKK